MTLSALFVSMGDGGAAARHARRGPRIEPLRTLRPHRECHPDRGWLCQPGTVNRTSARRPTSSPARARWRGREAKLALVVVVALVAGACATSVRIEAPEGAAADATPVPQTSDGGDTEVAVEGPVVIEGRYTWTDDDCAFTEPSGVNTRCGWLEVPERWDLVGGDTIRLHVGVFSAGTTEAAPVVYLEGGPGGDALANVDTGFDILFGGLVDRHDIVVLGQRGTGSAEPTLSCPEVFELGRELLDDALDATGELDSYTPAYLDCAADLRDRGIDLGAYNSVQNAHDVEALRLALGHEQWNVLGISYGTRLAQTLMRLHPGGVQTAILDSVLAYERAPTFDIPNVAKRAFETLFAECAASPACAGAYPDLEQRFFALVDQLDAEPVSFTAADLLTGDQFPAALNGDGLMNVTFGALYSKSSLAGLPELVTQLEQGDTSGAEALVSQDITGSAFFAEGMYWAVECHEEVPFISPSDPGETRTGDPRYDRLQPPSNGAFVETLCGAFDAGVAAPEEDELLVSDIPTLLLAGVFDPITPPADTESLLRGLANGQYVEFPHTGHGVMADRCAHELALGFLEAPGDPVDVTCVGSIEEPPWTPDLFAGLTFEPFSYDAALFTGSGVRPVGWEDLGDGTFAWTDNALHTSVILQQAVPGEIASLIVANVGDVLGGEPVELDPVDAGGRTWSHFEAPTPGSIVDMFVSEGDGTTLLVLLQHAPADRDEAVAALTQPLLEAFGA